MRFLLHALALNNASRKGLWPIAGPMLQNKRWGIALLIASDGDWLREPTRCMMRDLFGTTVFGQPDDPPSVFEPHAYALGEDAYVAAVVEIIQELAQAEAERTEFVSGFPLPWDGGWSLAMLACFPLGQKDGDAARTLEAIETLAIGIEDYAPPEIISDLTGFVALVRSYGQPG